MIWLSSIKYPLHTTIEHWVTHFNGNNNTAGHLLSHIVDPYTAGHYTGSNSVLAYANKDMATFLLYTADFFAYDDASKTKMEFIKVSLLSIIKSNITRMLLAFLPSTTR